MTEIDGHFLGGFIVEGEGRGFGGRIGFGDIECLGCRSRFDGDVNGCFRLVPRRVVEGEFGNAVGEVGDFDGAVFVSTCDEGCAFDDVIFGVDGDVGEGER